MYSKWGTSRWQTLWLHTEPMGIDDEVFSIDGYYELDYATVKDVGVGKAVWLLQARPESRHNVGSFHIGLTEVKYDLDIRKATPSSWSSWSHTSPCGLMRSRRTGLPLANRR